jgi:hypothetical protein
MGGPLSIGFPEPLKMRPSMSSDTGVFNTYEDNKREKNVSQYLNLFTARQGIKIKKNSIINTQGQIGKR